MLDERHAAAGSGEIGDLYIGGVGLSPGYWRDEEKTAAAFLRRPARTPTRRIYRTGDLARVDEDGLVHFLGRDGLADQEPRLPHRARRDRVAR